MECDKVEQITLGAFGTIPKTVESKLDDFRNTRMVWKYADDFIWIGADIGNGAEIVSWLVVALSSQKTTKFQMWKC